MMQEELVSLAVARTLWGIITLRGILLRAQAGGAGGALVRDLFKKANLNISLFVCLFHLKFTWKNLKVVLYYQS